MTAVREEPELRALLGDPSDLVRAKVSDRLNDLTRRFVDLSPFVLLATSAPDGTCDVSPRGDPAGFVRMLDERRSSSQTVRGTGSQTRCGTFLRNPHVGLLFLVPGVGDTLRVNGRAIVERTRSLAPSAVKGKVPKLGLRVEIDEVFTHCSRRFSERGSGIPRRSSIAPSFRARAKSTEA